MLTTQPAPSTPPTATADSTLTCACGQQSALWGCSCEAGAAPGRPSSPARPSVTQSSPQGPLTEARAWECTFPGNLSGIGIF